MASDERSSTEESSEEVENSATEISTDSEFEHDGTTPTRHEIPDILITDHNIRRNKPCEEAKKVQVKSGNIVKTNRNESKGVKLEFSPLVESKPASVLTKNTLNAVLFRPTPLVNPRRGDYYLSKTQSTEGIATKMSLELRKKYLLGNTGSSNAISKSGSATALDSRLKSFASNITECQKLLNPGNEISPTMQAFLQTTAKKPQPTSPTIVTPPLNLPPSSMIFRKQKELPPSGKDFGHVCGKEDKNNKMNVLNENVRGKTGDPIRKLEDIENKNEGVEDNKENDETYERTERTENNEIPDCRPRSPVHETSIPVPQIPWKVKNSEVASDSLSETETESESTSSESEDKGEEKPKPPPPRLEIHNSRGELMDEEGFELDSLQIENPEDKDEPEMEDPKSKVESTKDDEISNRKNSLSLSKDKSSSERNCPSSPGSVDESCHTFAALTETELSDWARDEDICVSGNLDDVENRINKDGSTSKKSKKEKPARKPKSLDLPKNNLFSHVCGKDKVPKMLASTENLDFADTDASEMDSVSATNNALIENRGYFRFVNEDDAPTPIVEVSKAKSPVQDSSSSSSSSKSRSTSSNEEKPSPVLFNSETKEDFTTEESTTSEQTTIKNSPVVNKNFDINDESFYSPLIDVSPISQKTVTDSENNARKENEEYEDYIQNLQGRLSPFHNVRDSIDYRKSRQKNYKTEEKVKTAIEEENEEAEAKKVQKLSEEGDTNRTSKKLREISRERDLQKDLVHDLVLKKVLPGKKSPADRKIRKITRNSPRILTTPANNQTPAGAKSSEKGFLENLDMPFADTSPENESFHTPAAPSCKRSAILPDTPLTNPEAFAGTTFEFKTPAIPKKSEPSTSERDKIREDARARAKMMSDEELGLSPEDKIKAYREKANKLLESPRGEKPPLEFPKKFESRLNKISGGSKSSESLLSKSSSTSKVFDKLRGSNLGSKSGQKSTSDLVSSSLKDSDNSLKSPGSSGPSTSSSSTTKVTDFVFTTFSTHF